MPSLVFLEVALPIPLRKTFVYSHAIVLEPGTRVAVPFGKRRLIGCIVGFKTALPSEVTEHALKAIDDVIDERPAFDKELLSLCQWLAEYYQHPLGEVLFTAVPKLLKSDKHIPRSEYWILTNRGKGLPESALKRAKQQQAVLAMLLKKGRLDQREMKQFSSSARNALIEKGLIERKPLSAEDADALEEELRAPAPGLLKTTPLVLNDEQQASLSAIKLHCFGAYLLHGITGSGKTEVYLQAIAKVIQAGRQALVLLPEIGLTPQTIKRFKARFNVPIVDLHSNVAEAQRMNNWLDAQSGKAKIVIGTRLASLTPFQDLGIIIVDEEHDPSFKQQDGLRYSARDLSVYRAKKSGIPIILGSATPSLESLRNAFEGRYIHLKLTTRAGGAIPPETRCVDLKAKELHAGLSEAAITAIAENASKNGQSLVFLNRRGYSPTVMCHACGWVADCLACDGRMTLHRNPTLLRCHRCDRQRKLPAACPSCHADTLQSLGAGTEQLESYLQIKFPDLAVIRIDRDATQSKFGLENQLALAEKSPGAILVGTQMLAKGHHLPQLSLVVVVDTDTGLLSPDFRALEHMGQLITQVAGRAGREQKKGKVLLQTHYPEHPLLYALLNEGYEHFAIQLLESRQLQALPPYRHLACLRAESLDRADCETFLYRARHLLSQHLQLELIGPVSASVARINNRHRLSLLVLSHNRGYLQHALAQSINHIDSLKKRKHLRWSIDVDATAL